MGELDGVRAARRFAWIRVAGWFVELSLAFFGFSALRQDAPLLALPMLIAFVVGIVKFHDQTSTLLLAPHVKPWFRKTVCGLVFGVGVVCLAASFPLSIDGLGLFGFTVTYLGVGLAIAVGRNHPKAATYGAWLLGGAAASWILGVVLFAVTGRLLTVVLLVSALALAPAGMSMLSRAATLTRAAEWWDTRRPLTVLPTSRWLPLVGAVVIAGVLGFAVSMLGVRITALLFVAAAAMLLAIISRSNVDITVVVIVGSVVWALAQGDVDRPDELAYRPDRPVLVALGDSFMSGEGADEFYDGTNRSGVNGCRQAPTAYAVVLVTAPDPQFPERLAFEACSGALTGGVREQLARVEASDIAPDDVGLVLVSAGGNDALFGVVGRGCLLPGDCAEFEQAVIEHLEVVRGELTELYTALAATDAFPKEKVAVVPYPVPISPTKTYADGVTPCRYSPFSPAEHEFLHRYTIALNELIVTTAQAAGLAVVDTMPDALRDHRICDGPAGEVGVNFLAFNGMRGTLEQSVLPANWVHNSLHPNATGHELMARAVSDWCAAEDCMNTGVEPTRPPADDAALVQEAEVAMAEAPAPDGGRCTVDDIGSTDSDEVGDCIYRAAYRRTGLALLWPGSFVVLGLLTLWVMLLWIVAAVRRRVEDSVTPAAG